MKFNELKEFIEKKMRLSHIYQPLLIKSLIETNGSATIRQLALSFLVKDEGLILEYEKTLKKMPLKILQKHNIIQQKDDLIKLNISKINVKQKAELIKLCEEKIFEYIIKRGISIWDYRLLDGSIIKDSLRYRLLKEAHGRCALCGATNQETKLDIDHILPLSKGGLTTYENLQVLCIKCNRSKGNRDQTNFKTKSEYNNDCIFCRMFRDHRNIILENDHAFVIYDSFPVTKGHCLIIPKRHFPDFFEAGKKELNYIHDLLRIMQKTLLTNDKNIDGFNVGVNSGLSAGQTVRHLHIHLIPRRIGDIENPKGGVRGVIPAKMKY